VSAAPRGATRSGDAHRAPSIRTQATARGPRDRAHPQITRPAKQLWEGVSKEDLARHMHEVAEAMLPHTHARPLTLVRAPDGVAAGTFFQKNARDLARWLPTCQSGDTQHATAARAEDLIRLADQAVVEVHGATATCYDLQRPDRLVFDFDPPPDRYDDVVDACTRLAEMLQRRGGAPHFLLTGSRGIHVVVPLQPQATYDEVKSFADAVARVLERHNDALTTQFRKRRRGNRIFIDTLRNRPRQTSILPWSPRARSGAPFALPVEDLADTRPDQARIGEAKSYLDARPWARFWESAVPLSRML
jgi:bifunctional non-homologous end joining protein LigD